MKILTSALICALPLAATQAIADGHTPRSIIIESELSYGQITRDGDGINSSVGPAAEIEDVTTFGLSGLVAYPIGQNLLTQLELGIEDSSFPAEIDGDQADDTYAGSHKLGVQLGYQLNNAYFGGFAGLGRVDSSDIDQQADMTLYGLGGRWAMGDWALAGQLGRLDTEANDPETPTDTNFARLVGQRYFNAGQTKLQLELAFAEGDQDSDSDPADGLKFQIIGLEVEHMMDWDMMGGGASIYGAAQQINVDETDDVGDVTKVSDLGISIGLRIRFGATSLQDRALSTAPDLPNVARWIGATPAVD